MNMGRFTSIFVMLIKIYFGILLAGAGIILSIYLMASMGLAFQAENYLLAVGCGLLAPSCLIAAFCGATIIALAVEEVMCR